MLNWLLNVTLNQVCVAAKLSYVEGHVVVYFVCAV